jgi:hypothetical protein
MPEIIIKYKNSKALDAIKDLAKYFDFVLEKPKSKKAANKSVSTDSLPIVFADKPDVTALAGIWKDKDISLTDLRKKAWGGRA